VAVSARELVRVLADEQAVVGALEHQARDLARMQDVLEARHRARLVARAVHARRVELHHAVGIRQAAQAHAVVERIGLLDLDHLDHDVERVGARGEAGVVLCMP
jgi:hypothetical protein